ncbi:hypothetical protein ERIC1_1c34050 [Paenibacillus larvae subsp. larvae DSM 25719]|uniref:Putative site-specific recombinase n=2 Tax=root TaxID=1 RepID=A0A2I7SCF4_9CAUD|nr:hypothetical protein HWB43_gp29 [Paenibacillus phage BN12]AUS03580.1 putative site-specific recombinase [Paenibacillus phage BN12]ETK29846.1 hypothetical protein ERIC1_1c34050 [Paenibacillus larvae subsp. larvae DSM 25719]
MALLTRTCRQCGNTFEGGPRAYYCPTCRAERTRKTYAEYKRRKRQGKARALGSTDTCERCGKSYVVNAGLQRFCPVCQPIHAAEHDRRTSLEFYREHKDRINPARNERRKKYRRKNIGKKRELTKWTIKSKFVCKFPQLDCAT